jgi:general secretion pathway protein F
MPVYDYTALDAKGKTVSGIIDADGAAAARQKIRSAGHYPVSLKEVREGVAEKSERFRFSLSQRLGRIRTAEVTLMTRQLATLIGAGFPLVSALDSVIVQVSSPGLKKVAAGVKDAIVEGSSFAGALQKYPSIFSPIYINMVRSGETSGTLEIVLQRLADITEKQEALKTRMITAMIYPVLILLISMMILFFLLYFVTPKILTMFEGMDQQLPLPTQILLALSNAFKSYWWLLALMVLAVYAGVRMLYKKPKGRRWIDQKILKLPMAGELARKLAIARFARTLESLLANGVSMLPSLEIVKNIVGNTLIAEVVEQATVNVGKGQALGRSLDSGQAFPPMAIQMIQVGEQSGELEQMLTKVADVFEKEVETTVMRMTAMLEPVMVLVMAGVVLFIVLSICLPIFEMNELIR